MLSLVPTFTPPPARSVNTNITVYERLKHLLTVNNSKTNIVSNYSRQKPKYQSANITSINNTAAHISTIEKDNFTLFDDELIVQDTSVIHKDDNSNTVSSIFSNRNANSLAYSSSSMLSGIPLFDLTSHNVTTTADIEDVNNTITITRSTVPATSLMMGMGPPKSDYAKAFHPLPRPCPPVQSSNDNTNTNMKLKTTINVNYPISNSTATAGGHASVSKRKADDSVESSLQLEALLRGSTSSSSNPRKKMTATAAVDKPIGKSIVGDDSLGNKENKSYNAKQNQSDWKQHSAVSSSAVESHMRKSIINGPVMMVTSAARYSSSCHDFCGIEQFCRNAGTSALSLRTLLIKVTHAGSICFSVLWRCLQTNHVTSTVKFCTASSQCINWHCTCDHQVRADYACNNILGVIIYIPNEATNSMMSRSSSGSNEMVYFIPLVPCLAMDSISGQDGDGDASSTAGGDYGYVLPLRCGTTLVDRWEAVMSIMGNSDVLKVNFNSQLSLLPLMKYVDSAKTNGSKTDVASTHPLNTTSLSSFTGLFDVRLAAYICDSTILEERLELEFLLQHSSIVVPAVDVSGLGAIARAIGRARAELRCVYELYIVLDHQLAEKRLRSMFIDLEMPTACLLCSMECLGIKVNRPYLDSIRRTIVAHIGQLEASIYQSVGGQHFNISSPDQVSHMLFEVLKLPTPTNHSKKGRLDVDDDAW